MWYYMEKNICCEKMKENTKNETIDSYDDFSSLLMPILGILWR